MRGNWGIWVRRPILWFLAVYIAGFVLSMHVPMRPIYIFLIMTATVIVGLFNHKKFLFPILLIILLLFGSVVTLTLGPRQVMIPDPESGE